jgi:hypothetical protein
MLKKTAMMPKPGTRRGPITPVRQAPNTIVKKRSSFRTRESLKGSPGSSDGIGLRMTCVSEVPSTPARASRSVVPVGWEHLVSSRTPKAIFWEADASSGANVVKIVESEYESIASSKAGDAH